MARSFNGTSDFGSVSNIGISGLTAITVGFWLWQNAYSNSDQLAMEYSVNANSNNGAFYVDPDSGGFPGLAEVSYILSPGVGNDVTLARPSAAAWHHWAVQIDAGANTTQVKHVYIDGVDQSLTNRVNNAGIGSFGNFTTYFMSRAGTSLFSAGRMDNGGIWSALLTAAEISSLAKGARPRDIRPTALLDWWPMDGLVSPEPELSGNARNMTLTGTAIIGGSPVMQFTPRWPQFLTPPVVTFSPAWAAGKNIVVEGVAT